MKWNRANHAPMLTTLVKQLSHLFFFLEMFVHENTSIQDILYIYIYNTYMLGHMYVCAYTWSHKYLSRLMAHRLSIEPVQSRTSSEIQISHRIQPKRQLPAIETNEQIQIRKGKKWKTATCKLVYMCLSVCPLVCMCICA